MGRESSIILSLWQPVWITRWKKKKVGVEKERDASDF